MTTDDSDAYADDVLADVMQAIRLTVDGEGRRDWATAHAAIDAAADRYGWELVGSVLLAKATGFLEMYARAVGKSRGELLDAYTLVALEDEEPGS